jgi:hypothetical protein
MGGVLFVAACGGEDSVGGVAEPSMPGVAVGVTTLLSPLSRNTLDNGALPVAEVEAITRLGATDAGPPPERDHGMAHEPGMHDDSMEPALTAEIDAARSSIVGLDTVEEARARGYVLATAPSPGIGTHWVLWSQIEQAFDPLTLDGAFRSPSVATRSGRLLVYRSVRFDAGGVHR